MIRQRQLLQLFYKGNSQICLHITNRLTVKYRMNIVCRDILGHHNAEHDHINNDNSQPVAAAGCRRIYNIGRRDRHDPYR